MRILPRNKIPFFPFDRFLVPSCCKDYFLEKFSDSVWWLYKPVMSKCEVPWKNCRFGFTLLINICTVNHLNLLPRLFVIGLKLRMIRWAIWNVSKDMRCRALRYLILYWTRPRFEKNGVVFFSFVVRFRLVIRFCCHCFCLLVRFFSPTPDFPTEATAFFMSSFPYLLV